MKCCYVDIHIHTYENADNPIDNYDVDKLEEKVKECAKGNDYLISLTDHNIININAYEKMYLKRMNFLVGVELHIRNYEQCQPYHCHFLFNFEKFSSNLDIFKENSEVVGIGNSCPGCGCRLDSSEKRRSKFRQLPHEFP